MSFRTETLRCPFCDRNHRFEVSDDVPKQIFEFHRKTVMVETRVVSRDAKKTVRAWDWTLHMEHKS